jgi:hypothetical protein
LGQALRILNWVSAGHLRKPCRNPINNYQISNNNITKMNFESKKASLVLLGATALLCSRTLFFFFNDPEGPNLLIVTVLAIVLYFLSFAAYAFVPSKITGLKRLSIAIFVQILAATALYFCMK